MIQIKQPIFKTKDGHYINHITFEDYLIYGQVFKGMYVKETSKEYVIEPTEKVINNKHDKLFKDLFSNKEEVSKFINEYLHLTRLIQPEELEKYTNSYITGIYENREADIVYKLKNKNIFFLIEHQSTIDRTMPYRITNYSFEILKSAIDVSKMKSKNYLYPKVISIVLYTGNRKWNAPVNFEDIQEELQGYSPEIKSYNLIDINLCDNSKLLNDNMLISKAMLIEKGKNKEEVVRNFKLIIENLNKLKIPQSNHLITVIQKYILNGVLDDKDKQEIINLLEKEGGENIMLNCVRVINEENARLVKQGERKGRKEGRKETITEIIINMLKNKFTDAQIKLASGINDIELEKIKKQIKT